MPQVLPDDLTALAEAVGPEPDALIEEWKEKDPIDRFADKAAADGVLTRDEMEAIRAANFLMNQDDGGAAWIRFNKAPLKPGEEARGRGGRAGGRRRRAS